MQALLALARGTEAGEVAEALGAIAPPAVPLITDIVAARLAFLVSGGTGSGPFSPS